MDPMTALEEERRQKEENEIQEIHELIHLEENFFKLRDFSGKGRTVVPSGKQRSLLEKVAKTIRFASPSTPQNNRKSMNASASVEEELPEDIHLVNNKVPRIYIGSLQVTSKTDSEKTFMRRSIKKTLFLFNDVLLVTNKKDSSESFEVTQVIWLHHLRLSYSPCVLPSAPEEEKLSFELIISSRRSVTSNPFQRNRATFSSQVYTCDNEAMFVQWIGELEDTILAYHRESEASRILGWFYDYVRGSFHSAAYLGDIQLIKKYLKLIEVTSQSQPSISSGHTSQRLFSSAGGMIQSKASIATLDKYLEYTRGSLSSLDAKDLFGMTALHWSSLRGHEGITRLLLQHGADVDALQAGGNTPLLLSVCSLSCAVTGIFDGRLNTQSEISTPRILLDRGADINCKNNFGLDVVTMAVLSSHSSKALPWTLQLLTSRGADCSGQAGSTALHLCAQRNLARAVRLLVDSGVDVNFLMAPPVLQYQSLYNFHSSSSLSGFSTHPVTPLLLACAHPRPDVETIRSFLDNGAFPNIRDAQGKTALLLILDGAPESVADPSKSTGLGSKKNSMSAGSNFGTPVNSKKKLSLDAPSASFSSPSGEVVPTNLTMDFEGVSTVDNYTDSDSDREGPTSPSRTPKSFTFKEPSASGDQKWRAMENTLHLVGDWAALTLPLVLELCKRGARIDNFVPALSNIKKILEKLRPSFRAAIMEAIEVWEKKTMPPTFLEFVMAKEQAGEDLKLHKGHWKRDKESGKCQLCCATFSLTFRRHHCRACGVLVCDPCSSKRLILSSSAVTPKAMALITNYSPPPAPTRTTSSSPKPTNAQGQSSSATNGASAAPLSLSQLLMKEEPTVMERVCDGCFNRLLFDASQPSADHYRARQLRQCALEVLRSVQELITSLDSSSGPMNETLKLNQELESLSLDFDISRSHPSTPTPSHSPLSLSPATSQSRLQNSQALVETLKQREMKLFSCENVLSKFLESADGYHKLSKRLIEQKLANNRLWGNNSNQS